MLYGMPLENMPKALFYNIDLFDQFGVPYPENGMDWPEIIDLARKLTLERDGVNYKGLSMGFHSFAFSQLSILGTEPERGTYFLQVMRGHVDFF